VFRLGKRIVDMICDILEENGSMQVSQITELINSKLSNERTRNTINTLIYSNLNTKGERLFTKVSYGRFTLRNGSAGNIKDNILEKLVGLMIEYQGILQKNNIDYNTTKYGIKFNKYEKNFIIKLMEKLGL